MNTMCHDGFFRVHQKGSALSVALNHGTPAVALDRCVAADGAFPFLGGRAESDPQRRLEGDSDAGRQLERAGEMHGVARVP
jgi:hypothetical protein